MFQFFKKRKEEKEIADIERKKRIKEYGDAARKNIDTAMTQMFEKPCPVNSNDKCFAECAHFKRGSVFYMRPWVGDGEDGYWAHNWPKCKLWGKN